MKKRVLGAMGLAMAEGAAERQKPLSAFKAGAVMESRDGTQYKLSNVAHLGSVPRMTLERLYPKRPAGISPRQWDRQQKAARRRAKARR